MRQGFYFLVFIILYSCGGPAGEEAPVADSIALPVVEVEEPALEYEDEPGFEYGTFDGVIITKTPAYENQDMEQPVQFHHRARLLVMPRKGDRLPMDGGEDECYYEGYHWYSVNEGGDAPSWIYGDNLFLRSRAKDYWKNDMTRDENDLGYKVGEHFYRFGMAASSFEDPPDAVDPIYCYDYGLPFLYQDTEPEVWPILTDNSINDEMDGALRCSKDDYLLLILNSDGCGTNITDFKEVSSGQFEVHLSIGYQEGMATGILYVEARDEEFYLRDFDFDRPEMEY